MNALIRPSFRQVSPERFEFLAVPIRLLHSALAQALRLASLEQLLGRPLPRRWRDEACPLPVGKALSASLHGLCRADLELGLPGCVQTDARVLRLDATVRVRRGFSSPGWLPSAFNVPGCLPSCLAQFLFSFLLPIPSVALAMRFKMLRTFADGVAV